jgi:hypothetical protein
MRHAFLGLVTTTLLLAAAPGWAGLVATGAVGINFGEDQRAVCAVANTGDKALTNVAIRIYGATNVVADSIVTTVNAGSVSSLLADAGEVGMSPFVRCEVEGSGIGKKTPVSLCITPDNAPDCLLIVTAP